MDWNRKSLESIKVKDLESIPDKASGFKDIYNAIKEWFGESETGEEALFVPYSQRNEKDIKEKKIVLSISKKARKQIYEFLERCNMEYQATDYTG